MVGSDLCTNSKAIFHSRWFKIIEIIPFLPAQNVFHFFHFSDRKDGRCSSNNNNKIICGIFSRTIYSCTCLVNATIRSICVRSNFFFVFFLRRYKKINVQKWFKFGNIHRFLYIFYLHFVRFFVCVFFRGKYFHWYFMHSLSVHIFSAATPPVYQRSTFYFIYTFRWLFITTLFLKE